MLRALSIFLFTQELSITGTAADSSFGQFSRYMHDWARHIAACNTVTGDRVASGSGFKMPLNWQARVEVQQIVDGKVQTSPFGADGKFNVMTQEGTRQRMTTQVQSKFVVAPASWSGTPQEWLNSTTYMDNDFMGFNVNGNKYPMNTPGAPKFHDMFAWLAGAHYGGKGLFNGRVVDRWLQNSSSFPGVKTSFELLVADMGEPVHFWQNSSASFMGQVRNYQMGYTFVHYFPNKTQDDLWEAFNKTDYLNPKRCVRPPTVRSDPINKTMYIFHPVHQFDIAGQDLGDATGDTVFVCIDTIQNQTAFTDHAYAWLTQWDIELVPKWGQYQNCNGYNPPQCASDEHFLVGHEAAYYLGVPSIAERQCGSNPLVGEWYSLPAGGECKAGARSGDGSCTWRKTRVKTIDGKCLIRGHGFRSTCVKEQRAPFPQAREVFLKAFASDDPSKGGCPEIAPESSPTPSSEIVV